jgi:nitrogen-specific signal transduction histidine kinase
LWRREDLQNRIQSSSCEESGNGLGLWVSRAIVQTHEGNIRLTSTASGYLATTVSIFLPLKPKGRMHADEAAEAKAT